MDEAIAKIYGDKVRIRACGLCWVANKLLLVNHRMYENRPFWAPPGGGVEFAEEVHKTLKREFREETGLEIEVSDFAFGCEFIRPPLHAVELFFRVNRTADVLKRGYDPELQIIQDVKFFSEGEIQQLHPDEKHGIFRLAPGTTKLKDLVGFYSI